MPDMMFNFSGKSHHMRVLAVDKKDTGATVYEALVDGREYVYWEADPDVVDDLNAWSVFAGAIRAYLSHEQDDSTTQTRWRD